MKSKKKGVPLTGQKSRPRPPKKSDATELLNLMHHPTLTEDAIYNRQMWLAQSALIPRPYRGVGPAPADFNEPGNTITALSFHLAHHPEDTVARIRLNNMQRELITSMRPLAIEELTAESKGHREQP